MAKQGMKLEVCAEESLVNHEPVPSRSLLVGGFNPIEKY